MLTFESLVSPQFKIIPAVSDAFAAQNYQKDSHLQVRLNPLKALNTFLTSVPGGGQSCGEKLIMNGAVITNLGLLYIGTVMPKTMQTPLRDAVKNVLADFVR